MYDRASSATEIDAITIDMFERKQRLHNAIPPTQALLVQHARRAAYQTGCIWDQATVRQTAYESPAEWGWRKEDNVKAIIFQHSRPMCDSNNS